MPREVGLCRSSRSTSRKWEILDIAETRFYSFSDSYITHYLRWTSRDFKFILPCAKYTLAADGGLVYEMYCNIYDSQRHIVCNPVSRDIHQITEPIHPVPFDHDLVVMPVNRATQSYRIVILQSNHYWRPAGVYLYDSKTLKYWRNLCKVPRDEYRVHSSIFLKGALFTLFFDLSTTPWCPKLYACDLESGDWSYIDVDLPRLCHPQDRLQLVVSLDRLFVVEEFTGGPSSNMAVWKNFWHMNHGKKNLCNATISEILFSEREVKKVAEMPKYLEDPRRMGNKHRSPALVGSPVVALGWGDSIVISFRLWLPVAVWDLTC